MVLYQNWLVQMRHDLVNIVRMTIVDSAVFLDCYAV